MSFFAPDWFWWTFGIVSVVVTGLCIFLQFSPYYDDRETGRKILQAYWGGIFALTMVAIIMLIVIKPVLNELWMFLF